MLWLLLIVPIPYPRIRHDPKDWCLTVPFISS